MGITACATEKKPPTLSCHTYIPNKKKVYKFSREHRKTVTFNLVNTDLRYVCTLV